MSASDTSCHCDNSACFQITCASVLFVNVRVNMDVIESDSGIHILGKRTVEEETWKAVH